MQSNNVRLSLHNRAEDQPISIATLSLFRFDGVLPRLWVLGQMGAARLRLRGERRAEFWKLCGSGTGQGFTPRPNWGVWAILATWPDEVTARDAVATSPVFARWRARAAESWTLFLAPTSSRGAWGGVNPFTATSQGQSAGPIIALTRATIRPARALRFWNRVPDISAVIGADPNVIFKIGIGEVPLLHQVTFSVWPDAASMANFARGSGPHGRAIDAVRSGDWFAEELYARFALSGTVGSWEGGDPLARYGTQKDAA
ncbi:MAG: spheroidene monooxygenase [Pseudotabrizicola sp.]|uniref:spheroidene monooxygenase n=1 Tax=Pseudotabrizicola sp. TaxID=2939647 RepID=UPI0027239FF2|nr:spheroidene monooxygenase [Pseudotabrizicola sp.]MDO9640462.1 spheroidene monooxygenase [Pseudotabrizicola sp.]